jgi:excisionase family DNA binding protein
MLTKKERSGQHHRQVVTGRLASTQAPTKGLDAIMARETKYLTLSQAAERYGVSVRTLRRRIAEGRLPAYRVGPRSIRVAEGDLARLARPIPTAGDGAA